MILLLTILDGLGVGPLLSFADVDESQDFVFSTTGG